jgi:MFS family permease
MNTLVQIPWSLKIFLGIFSDGIPIFGYRRKFTFVTGWLLYALSYIILSMCGRPSINTVAAFSSLSAFFMLVADVSTDALCVERSKYELESMKGNMQSSGYIARTIGGLIGGVTGSLIYNKANWGWGLSISTVISIIVSVDK